MNRPEIKAFKKAEKLKVKTKVKTAKTKAVENKKQEDQLFHGIIADGHNK